MRRIPNKLKSPFRPWDMLRIKEEREIKKEFGLKNKHEIWSIGAMLRNFRQRARSLIAERNEKEEKLLINKLVKLGLLQAGTGLDNVLALSAKDVLSRRLESVLVKKGLALTPKQARQFITHGHVVIGDKKVNVPSYIVSLEDEGKIAISPLSRIKNRDLKQIQKPKREEKAESKEEASEGESNVGETAEIISETEEGGEEK